MITGNRGKAPPCRDPKYFKSPTADAARAAVSREPRRPRKRYSDYTQGSQSIRIGDCRADTEVRCTVYARSARPTCCSRPVRSTGPPAATRCAVRAVALRSRMHLWSSDTGATGAHQLYEYVSFRLFQAGCFNLLNAKPIAQNGHGDAHDAPALTPA